MKARIFAAAFALLMAAFAAEAQVSVDVGGTRVDVGAGDVKVQAEGRDVRVRGKGVATVATDGSTASSTIGGIGDNVDIQGVAVINGRVYIDSKEIPPSVTRYKSPRTGEVYNIRRHKDGSVEVTSEGGGKK